MLPCVGRWLRLRVPKYICCLGWLPAPEVESIDRRLVVARLALLQEPASHVLLLDPLGPQLVCRFALALVAEVQVDISVVRVAPLLPPGERMLDADLFVLPRLPQRRLLGQLDLAPLVVIVLEVELVPLHFLADDRIWSLLLFFIISKHGGQAAAHRVPDRAHGLVCDVGHLRRRLRRHGGDRLGRPTAHLTLRYAFGGALDGSDVRGDRRLKLIAVNLRQLFRRKAYIFFDTGIVRQD